MWRTNVQQRTTNHHYASGGTMYLIDKQWEVHRLQHHEKERACSGDVRHGNEDRKAVVAAMKTAADDDGGEASVQVQRSSGKGKCVN